MDRWRKTDLYLNLHTQQVIFQKKKKNPILSFWGGASWALCIATQPPPPRLLHRKGELYISKAFLKENLSVNTCGFVTLGERDERETIFILLLSV